MGIGNLLTERPAGTMAASIPYTSVDVQGHSTINMFTATHKGLYNRAVDFDQCNYITFEAGNRDFFFNYKFSGNLVNDMAIISGGKRIQLNHNFAAKVSLGFAYNYPWKLSVSSTGYDSLGSIDNLNKTIIIAGKTFNPTFQNSKGQNEQANQLSVYYSQSNISLIPRISLGQSDYRHFYYWDFFLEYHLPVSKHGELDFFQNNSEPGESVTLSHQSNVVTYNGHVAGKIPPVFQGFYAGFTLGISLSGKDRYYDRQRHSSVNSKRHLSVKKHKEKSTKKKKQNQNNKGKDNSRGW
jgi:hypothetical protein